MSERSEQINVRMSAERKQEWEEFAEESRAVDRGVSELVRKAVTAYIQADGDPTQVREPTSEAAAVPADVADRLSSIEAGLSSIETTVERIDESAGFIERYLVEDDDGEPTEWDRLLRMLAPAKPTTEQWGEYKEEYRDDPVGDPIVWDGTLEAYADELGVEEGYLEQVFDSMRKGEDIDLMTEHVETQTRYWVPRDPRDQPFGDARTIKESLERREYVNRQEPRE